MSYNSPMHVAECKLTYNQSLFSPCNTVEPIVFWDTSAGSQLIKSKHNFPARGNSSHHNGDFKRNPSQRYPTMQHNMLLFL